MSQEQGTTPSETTYRYTAELAGEIETKWQDRWEAEGTFHADNPVGELAGPLAQRNPYFLLDMFPYPSGKGLHVGHPLGYIATDTVARFRRMKGDNVLYTMGYDAFGLPAEQFAVQTGQHPRITTEENVANMRRQLRRMGLSYDHRRTLSTTDNEYVKWTQWIFLQIFNSWFDEEATAPDGSLGAARPIEELRAKFAAGEKEVPGDRLWEDLSEVEQAKLVDSYRLAYVSEAPVNWCPGLGTVLANEEVTAEGRSERGNYPVFKRNLRQWMMRITAYGKRLTDDLDGIDWPEKVRSMQRHWIGRSEGADVEFNIDGEGGLDSVVTVYTTRPDTLFGATFCVWSPEHPLLEGTVPGSAEDAAALAVPSSWPAGTREEWTGGYATPAEAVAAYRAQAAAKTPEERAEDAGEKTGVFTGLWATNPVNGKQIPVFIADSVLMDYGTGAIMAVPAHDDRDWAFATKFNLDIIRTIGAAEDPYGHDLSESAYTGDGVAVDSANEEISLNGLSKDEAKAAMIEWLEAKELGKGTVTYRLRDWLFSRQRYWGEPFPIVWDENGLPHGVPEDMLPVELPEVTDYSPRTFDPEDADTEPEAPLGRTAEWVNVEMDLGDGVKAYKRETNTMPQWAGSSWYEMRYTDPTNDDALSAPENLEYWMGPREGKPLGGTDLYIGGVEHAVLHLLYARFWQKVLFDLGHVPDAEPYNRLFNQGYVQAYAYKDVRGQYVPADEVEGDAESGFTYQGQPVTQEYGKMGKSLKNIVTPDDMYDAYGADVFRVYEMSMGPLDLSRPWDTRAVIGSQRFLQRLWRNVINETTGAVTVTEDEADLETKRLVARTIADATVEFENLRINTAIAKLIVLNNHLTGLPAVPREAIEPLILMVSPVAPHIAEELWAKLGHEESLARVPFPVVTDESLLVEDTVTAIVQLNGKVRVRLEVAPSISAEDLEALALETEAVQNALEGAAPLKVIVRAPNLVNVVLPRK